MNYKAFAKEGTFLHDYMGYMDAQESPHAYDFWCAMWLLGNACGRFVFVDRPRAPIYMNWYVILVADSGVTRKSTAVRIATKLAYEFNERAEHPFHLVQQKTTPEALEWELHKWSSQHGYAHAAISISELVTLLGKERYTRTMPGLLTDLYDCDELRVGGGTIGGGQRSAKNIFVTLLSASTPSWLQRAVNPDVVEGGFTSRVLFIASDKRKKRIPWPEEDDTDAERRERIVRHLLHVRAHAQRVGRITITPGGRKTFSNWYANRRENTDSYRNSFESREDAHVLRLAACFCINDDRWVIDHYDIKTAIRVMGEVKEHGAALFDSTFSHSKHIAGVDRLRTLLVSAGMDGLSQHRLTVGLQHYFPAKDTITVLEIMHEIGLVQKFAGIKLQRGRPKTLWRATALMTQPGMMEEVLQRLEPV